MVCGGQSMTVCFSIMAEPPLCLVLLDMYLNNFSLSFKWLLDSLPSEAISDEASLDSR